MWYNEVCEEEPSKGTATEVKLAENDAKICSLTEIVKVVQTQNQTILRVLEGLGKNQPAHVTNSVNEFMEEQKDKETRAKNIILYNVPEPVETGEEGQKEDEETISKLLGDICGEEEGLRIARNKKETKRLGKPQIDSQQNTRPRPIKLTLMNTEDKEQVTQKAKNLKNSKNFKKVGVSTDKTLKEREADKKLLTELRTRRDKEEEKDNIPNFPQRTSEKLLTLEISTKDMEDKLKKLNPTKSEGPDGLHPRILKELAHELSYPLKILFDKSINENKIPTAWKQAERVTVILIVGIPDTGRVLEHWPDQNFVYSVWIIIIMRTGPLGDWQPTMASKPLKKDGYYSWTPNAKPGKRGSLTQQLP
ncbi:hypothetical protein ACOMHN_063468 [Nucella lapillus]